MVGMIRCGYWNIRGLMQPIRLLLAYLEVPYKDVRYDVKPCTDGSWDRTEWTSVKDTLGLDFPNLPYLIDDETGAKVVQSNAILRYICDKYKPEMLGKTINDRATVEMLMGAIGDLKCQSVRIAYGPEYEKNLEPFRVSLQEFISRISMFIKNSQFAVGAYLTCTDFVLYENLDVWRLMCPEEFESMEAKILVAYLKRIEAIPQIAEYMKSPEFIQRPINNKMASFK